MVNYIKLPGLIRKLKKSGYPDIPITKSDEQALLEGCYFDFEKGWDPVDYIECFCKTTKSEFGGDRLELQPWQTENLIVPMFGWQRPEGIRRITKAIVFIPKKNGKSTLCSALSVYGVDPRGDGEPGSEVYLSATSRDQANIVYKEAANMIEASPLLKKKFQLVRSTKTINCGNTSWARVLSAEGSTAEGINAHMLIMDELHRWRDRDFFSAIIWSMAARRQPLTVMISTAGEDLDSIGGEEYWYAKKIISGDVIDTTVLALVYEATHEDDLDDEKVWHKANPSLGVTIPIERFRSDLITAKQKGGKDWADFKRYRFNLWGGAEAPYLNSLSYEKKCFEPFNEDDLRGLPCYAGLDLSSKEDFTSFCMIFKDQDQYKAIWRHWIPEDKIKEKLDKNEQNYFKWHQQGHIIAIPGSRIDQEEVKKQIDLDIKKFDIQEFAVESYNAQGIIDFLQERIPEVVEAYASFKHYSDPTKELKSLIEAGLFKHNGNPVAAWQFDNLRVKENSYEDVLPVKRAKKVRYKIDACVAAILALKLAMSSKEFVSIYEQGENLSLKM